jgi:hypothetical protein
MSTASQFIEISCSRCGAKQRWGFEAVLRCLVNNGKFRRTGDPTPEVVFELFYAFAPTLPCPSCEEVGFFVKPATGPPDDAAFDDPDDDWNEAVLCRVCRKPIPSERLAAVPGVKVCVPCGERVTRGKIPPDDDPSDACPRCGTPLVRRLVRAGGANRVEFVCPKHAPPEKY